MVYTHTLYLEPVHIHIRAVIYSANNEEASECKTYRYRSRASVRVPIKHQGEIRD